MFICFQFAFSSMTQAMAKLSGKVALITGKYKTKVIQLKICFT